jgi:hypothetical protein
MSRKIIFEHHRALGDCVEMTLGVRDFSLLFPNVKVNVKSNFPELWENNPYLDRSLKKGDPGVEFYAAGYSSIQDSNSSVNSFHTAFLWDMICQADAHESLGMSLSEFCSAFSGGRVGDGEPKLFEGSNAIEPFISFRNKYKKRSPDLFRKRGDLHLTDVEKSNNFIKDSYGSSHYWVIAPGGKSDCTCKIWDWRKFQPVIDHFKGFIDFVVLGRSDHIIEPLKGAISVVDKLSIRDILSMVHNSEGCVSGISFLMHCAAALPQEISNDKGGITQRVRPCVSIYGGREPQSFTGYEGHQILHTGSTFTCCDCGGCWQSRTVALQKKPEENKRLCFKPVEREGRTVQACMDVISSYDVIRAIEKYYEGDTRSFNTDYHKIDKMPTIIVPEIRESVVSVSTENTFAKSKEINILASLKSKGGGEQSAIKIVELLRGSGWKVNLYPWADVHKNYKHVPMESSSFIQQGSESDIMTDVMKPELPLLFYANDNIGDFCNPNITRTLIEKSSGVIIGINYVNDRLPRSAWLASKTKAIIFQNQEKKEEFVNQSIGFDKTELITMFGAIDLKTFENLPVISRQSNEPLVVLKHCCPDYRKYITKESEGKGEKYHTWQRNLAKDRDVVFYSKLLREFPGDIRFEFMEAHPELIEAFRGDSRMIFHPWDSMPVKDFLQRGHLYLYRSSNLWRDQYPRCVAEALAAGLPVLSEPRDGTKDRIQHGDTGFYCCDYDAYLYSLKLLYRKEGYRKAMGESAKKWAVKNLNPERWVSTIENILS